MRSFIDSRYACLFLVVLGLGATPAPAEQSADDARARLLFQEAVRLEEQGQLDEALREYDLVATRFPRSPVAPVAILRHGWGLFRQGDDAGARAAAERLTGGYPESRHAASGQVLAAEILAQGARQRSDLENARAELRRIPRFFPRQVFPLLPERAEARVRDGEISYLLGDHPLASAAFVRAIEDEVRSEWTIRAQLGLAQVLLAGGDWLAAADLLQRVEAAGGSEGRFDAEVTAQARRLQTLIHRLVVKPLSGQDSWASARTLRIPGEPLRKPVALAAHDDGSLAVVDQGGTWIRLTPDGEVDARATLKSPARPWSDGRRFHLAGADHVVVLPDLSRRTFEIPRGDKRERVKGLAAGGRGVFGQFFLLQRSPAQVTAFDAEGGHLGDLSGDDPVDLAVDGRGRLYVLSGKTRQVVRFSPEGVAEGVVVRGSGRQPVALAVDVLGRVYVLDRGDRTIRVHDPEGEPFASIGPRLPGGLELRNPQDLAIDGSGRVYVADPKQSAVLVLE